MTTGRLLIDRLRRGEPAGRAAYVPFFSSVAARIGGTGIEAMMSDPGLWTSCLVKTAELLDLDGVVAGFDRLLVAEACGCRVDTENETWGVEPLQGPLASAPEESERWADALETTKRVFHACRQERMCVAAMTGPLSLATQLFGPDGGAERVAEVKGPLVRLAEAYCETRPDVLCIVELGASSAEEMLPGFRRLYQTLRNVASYYDIPVALYLEGYEPGALEPFGRLGLDMYLLGPSTAGAPPRGALEVLSQRALAVGLGLPIDDLQEARRLIDLGHEIDEALGRPGGLLFTSHEATSCTVDIDMLHDLVHEIERAHL